MSRNTIRAAATIMLAALLVMAATPATAATASSRRVVIVLAPYLTWDDLLLGPMPETRAVAENALLANANVRSGAVGGGAPTLARGALMLSTGASALSDPEALSAFSASESVGPDSTAEDAYRRIFGRSAGRADVLYLGQPREGVANLRQSLTGVAGALGGAVRSVGALTVAIGNSDPGMNVDVLLRSRPAGVIAADESGRVLSGDVSTDLLLADRGAPYGVRTDLVRVEAAYRAALARPGAALVVLDPGDLARSYTFASMATTASAEAARRDALRATDRVVGLAAKSIGPRDVLIVVAPLVPDVQDQPPAFAPLILKDGSGPGIATAASTHLRGVVTVMDISASVVESFGVKRPVAMVGSRIVAASGAPAGLSERVHMLARMNSTAIAVEVWRLNEVNTYITISVIVLLIATLLLYRGAEDIPGPVCRASRAALVFIPSVPAAALLAFLFDPFPQSPGELLAVMFAVSVLLFAMASWSGRGRPATVPLMVVTGVTSASLLIDQWFGGPLSFATTFSYSPLFGARYYGLGNEMAGLLLGCVFVCAALALDTWPDAPWARPFRIWGWPLLGVVVLGTSAAPFMGANVGTVAWMTVGFLVGWLMLNGRKVWTWRNVLVAALMVVVIVGALIAIDLGRGSGSETHLGRAVTDAGSGGVASLWTIIARKADTNLRVIGRTNWTWLLVVVLGLLGYMRWRPHGEFAGLLKSYPAFASVLGAALFAGLVGYFTEDSGIIIPALLVLPVGLTALYLMMSRPGWRCGEGS